MKKINILFLFLSLGLFVACNSDSTSEEATNTEAIEEAGEVVEVEEISADEMNSELIANVTTMEFSEYEHNFGDIPQGDQVEHEFEFTNTGENPLIITNARGSCGCTVPSYPKEPIPSGESAKIMVKFDSKGKNGDQTKNVTITANTQPSETKLYIKGKVLTPEVAE